MINKYRVGNHNAIFTEELSEEETKKSKYIIEPWLSALFQSEHLSILVGSGFTTGAAVMCNTYSAGMDFKKSKLKYSDDIEREAKRTALLSGRGDPNLEDQIR